MTDPKTTRIVLLGKTGAGKSSLANTIFREKLFKVLPGFRSVTSVCETKTKSVSGRNITLIDTPGFFDTHRHEEEIKHELVRCITECSPGIDAFLIVFKVERFTVKEEDIIHRMTEYFSEEVYKYATVVFTHGHELPKGETIKDLVKKNKSLSDFVEKCGGRCHVIDNKHWRNYLTWKYRSNKFQVNEILQSIDKTVEANNRQCYTNEAMQITEELIQQEEKNIAATSENMSKEQIRTEAKNRVNKILIQAAGITVGALMGALFGVVLPAVLVAAGITGGMKTAVGKAAAALTLGARTIRTVAAVAAGAEAVAAGAAAAGAEAVAAGAAAAGAEAVAAGAAAAGAEAVAAGAAAAGAEAVAAGAAVAGAAGAEAVAGAGAVGAAGAKAGAGAVGAGVVGTGAVGAAGVIGTGLAAGVAAVGVVAAVGAGLGGYEGHQAAQTAETPWEAAEMASEAVCSKGLKAIKGAYNLVSHLEELYKEKDLKEKGSKT